MKEKEGLSLSVIVPTKGRPHPLRECIASILRQDRLPEELIVIDQSPEPLVGNPVRETLSDKHAAVRWIYVHAPEIRGLPQARNAGVALSGGDILLFLDDVLLGPGYLRSVLKAFRELPDVGGVGGVVTPRLSRKHALLARGFLFGPFRGEREVILWQHRLWRRQAPIAVQGLSGCNMSFRREIFHRHRFDERLEGQAVGEDLLFTYRVSRHYKLVLLPTAWVVHSCASSGRLDGARLKEAQALFYYYFYKRCLHPDAKSLLSYLWCNVGLGVSALFHALMGDIAHLRGLYNAWQRLSRVRRGRSSIEEELRSFYEHV